MLRLLAELRICRFRQDETGGTTVDWVVLTAAMVGLGFAVLLSLFDGTQSIGLTVGEVLGKHEVAPLVFPGQD